MNQDYEQATLEFRQVKHKEWLGDYLNVWYTVQQKWLVQKAEEVYRYKREEWRDLPEVNAKDL